MSKSSYRLRFFIKKEILYFQPAQHRLIFGDPLPFLCNIPSQINHVYQLFSRFKHRGNKTRKRVCHFYKWSASSLSFHLYAYSKHTLISSNTYSYTGYSLTISLTYSMLIFPYGAASQKGP